MSTHSQRDDPVAGLTRLAASVRSLRHTVRAGTRVEGHHRGSDAHGVVSVVADGAGQVESVDIDREWFARTPASSVGPALLEAYQAAMVAVLDAVAERMSAAEREAPPPVAAEAAGRSSDAERPATLVAPSFADVRAALHDLEERQYERERRRRLRQLDRPQARVVHGPHRMVSVTVRGGDIAEITVANGVRRDRAATLGEDVVLALRAARSQDDATRSV
ncbi:YbaB/EbfC family nucleoid-associated protein [Micromonospora endophytica]|uniref:YbaB/EbfC family nucleoid-associated protein n=1 Tax=Micromonospora endophytica TaxID=515350 RepID=UPI0015E8C100|nr:YbaB/EbfC family nucleoid-associated protein [Micromonospora endophytica]